MPNRFGDDQLQNVLVVLLCMVFAACATSYDARGRIHQVRRAETIWSVARAYRVDVQELAELNNIEDPHDIHAGMNLHIPERERRPEYKRSRFGNAIPARVHQKRGKRGARNRNIEVDHSRFRWPVIGPVISNFGYRNGRRHDGVDIKANQGTPIRAAEKGSAVFVGKMRGYGNLILLRHDGDFFTAYAHNSLNIVRRGQEVKKGQIIGKVGRTGRATGAHLHFEVRHGQIARNPLFFLPKKG